MKSRSITMLYACAFVLAHALNGFGAEQAEKEIDRLIKQYDSIRSVTCSVRKTSKAGGQTVRMLSRVHFRRDGYIHVENVSPSRRRIIADGKQLYYYDEKAKKGFSLPVDKLDKVWAASLNTIPASPLDHLIKIKQMKPGKTQRLKTNRRIVFHGKKNHVALTLDSKDRILSLEFYNDPELKDRYAIYEYSDFIKAGDTWLPRKHYAELKMPDGSKATETRFFDNLAVNTEIPDKLFDHSLFFRDVEFVSDFNETWQ